MKVFAGVPIVQAFCPSTCKTNARTQGFDGGDRLFFTKGPEGGGGNSGLASFVQVCGDRSLSA